MSATDMEREYCRILTDLITALRDSENYTIRPVLADWAERRMRRAALDELVRISEDAGMYELEDHHE